MSEWSYRREEVKEEQWDTMGNPPLIIIYQTQDSSLGKQETVNEWKIEKEATNVEEAMEEGRSELEESAWSEDKDNREGNI